MGFAAIEQMTAKEREQFKAICNQLLSRTFVVRTLYHPDKGRVNNPDYNFLTTHYEVVKEYLSFLDWELNKVDYHGYFYVLNTDEANRCSLNKVATSLLLALRMIYEENQERVGLEHDVICTVHDVLEKVVTDYAILPTRPSMDEIKKALSQFENHSVLQRIEGKFNQVGCKFAVLPTILTVVSGERLDAVVSALRKEEDGLEEAEEDPAD